MILFVCWANVWRSQVAEWIARYFWINAISCASVEARKEKYNWKPEKEITKLLCKKYDIDISNQEILYSNDIKKDLLEIDEIIFLFDPKEVDKIDEEVLIDNMPLWTFLDMIGKKYKIFKVKDPDWEFVESIDKIIDKIYFFIKNNYVK